MSVMSIVKPDPAAQQVARTLPPGSDADALPSARTLADDAPELIGIAIVVAAVGFFWFARRRMAWLARQTAARMVALVRWLRMDAPDEI
jgi:hypothetical protein